MKAILINVIRMLQGKGDLQYRCPCGLSWLGLNYADATPRSTVTISCDKCLGEITFIIKKGVKL